MPKNIPISNPAASSWIDRLNYPAYAINDKLEIQFSSKAAKQSSRSEQEGQSRLCYEVIMHRDIPCSFCKIFPDGKSNSANKKFSEKYKNNFNSQHSVERENTLSSQPGFTLFQNMLKVESGEIVLFETLIPLRRKDNAEEQLITLGAMVQTMAHELSNPLTGINLTLQAIHNLIDKDNSNLKHKLEKIIALLEKDARRASNILTDVQNYTKPLKQQERLCKLKLVIQEALGISLRTQPYISPKIIWNWDLPENICVRGNRQKLEQCFINLFVNAFEALQESSLQKDATIEINAVHSDTLHQTNKTIQVEIVDNADGLLFQDADNIFSPFKSTKKDHTGLGLFIVRKILNEHKAKIDTTRENSKTYFTITIEGNI